MPPPDPPRRERAGWQADALGTKTNQRRAKYKPKTVTGKAGPGPCDLRRFHREAAGVVEIIVVRQERDAPWLLAKLLEGDQYAWAIYRALDRWLDNIEVNRPLCVHAGCAHEFTAHSLPASFLICVPWRDDRTTCLISGVCRVCAEANSDDAIGGWVRQLWPGGRMIEMPRQGGRA